MESLPKAQTEASRYLVHAKKGSVMMQAGHDQRQARTVSHAEAEGVDGNPISSRTVQSLRAAEADELMPSGGGEWLERQSILNRGPKKLSRWGDGTSMLSQGVTADRYWGHDTTG
ncbi:hypothetical protein SCUP515_12419 [Seiridium cupressi]